MLRSFKIRLLLVIIITTMVSLSMQLSNSTREVLTPVLSFMLKDYEVEKKVALMWENLGLKPVEHAVPVITQTFSSPCETYEIEKAYGWYWNEDAKEQEFLPGVWLSVPDNSLIKAVSDGTVKQLGNKESGRTIVINHTDGLYSYYQGLKEILVEKNAKVSQGEVLGKSSESFYFELRSEDGPINPLSIFN